MTLSLSSDRPPAALPTEGQATSTLFFNREQSWLKFNQRVLHEALDERTPLLERVAFLAIFNSNLDEYYQKRVGGLKRQIDTGVKNRSGDGLTPQKQLKGIRQAVLPMLQAQADCYTHVIKPQLAQAGIHLLKWDELSESLRGRATDYFKRNLFPVLTPLAVDPGHPFPFISNLSTSLGVLLSNPEEQSDDASEWHFARVKVPAVLPGWVLLSEDDDDPDQGMSFIGLDELIRHNLSDLFEGMTIHEVEPFRITRNADVDRDEEDAEDLLAMIAQELRDRRFARVCRLEVDDDPSLPINRMLIQQLNLHAADVYQMPAELDYTNLWQVHGLSRPELKYDTWTPMTPPRLIDAEADMFSVIQAGDLLVHHPYESFAASVERFIRTAANDPDVVAIKLTLYRTTQDAPFLPELIRAAEMGKQVVCLVELSARFDEERNVQIASVLEKAGVHVVYGVVGLKTHTKTALVVRKEDQGMKVYAHVGTGNYNAKTAGLYTDLGLFTCDRRITDDLVEMFHFLTGRSVKKDFRHLLIAPVNMRRRFVELIDREIEHAQAWHQRGADPDDPHRPHIIAKMNSLEDQRLCKKLYEASQAGVRIQLIVRGFCCLRPGVPGLSEHITVTSVIGRFLEHSRIYTFHNQGQPDYYIGSADWMYRNLNNRVECITPIFDPVLQARLKEILDVTLADQRQGWDLHPDGTYIQRQPDLAVPASAQGTHPQLMAMTRKTSQLLVDDE